MEKYPLPVFHYTVGWGGTNVGFSEVSGLTIETDPIEYRHGADNEFTKIKMPGLKKFSNITLKRGIMEGDNEFYDWLNTTKMNEPDRRDLTISLLNESHEPVRTWKVNQAWPLKVEGPGLKADDNSVAVETVELAHEGIKME